MSKMVKGVYTNAQETLDEINKLKAEGYMANEITVVTAQGKNTELKDLESANISTADVTKENQDSESIWEKIKDMFTVDHYKKGHPADNPLAEYGVPDGVANDLNYKKELEDGKILIIIDDKKELHNDSTTNDSLL